MCNADVFSIDYHEILSVKIICLGIEIFNQMIVVVVSQLLLNHSVFLFDWDVDLNDDKSTAV